MMGEQRVMQEALFYGFSLERRVPDNHLLRKIDRFVDLSEVRAHLGPYYSEVGRPSIDPELMIRMLIVGYLPDRFPDRQRPRGSRTCRQPQPAGRQYDGRFLGGEAEPSRAVSARLTVIARRTVTCYQTTNAGSC